MKVAVYFAEGYEEVEALSVVDVLRRGKIEVIMTGVEEKIVASARGIKICMDAVIDELDHDTVDMIVLPGGMPGVTHLEKSEKVIKNIKTFKEQGKWLAAICAAPSILGKNDLLIGERATCYPGHEKSLNQCEHCNEATVISGKIVTSKAAGTALHFALILLEVLKGKEAAEEVKKAMVIDCYE